MTHLADVFVQGRSVIIGFISGFILELLGILEHQVVVALTILAGFITWIILSEWVRQLTAGLWKEWVDPRWLGVLKSAMEVVTLLGVFLVVRFFLKILQVCLEHACPSFSPRPNPQENWTGSDFNILESGLGLFILILGTITVYHQFRYLKE